MENFKPSSTFLFFLLAFAIAFPSLIHAQNNPQDYVNAHNAARSQVNVPGVTWDNNLAVYAQNYANQRAASGCNLIHSNGPYGENIAWGSGYAGGYSGTAAVNDWVNEKMCYHHDTNSCTPNSNCNSCGHYTQVVWRNTNRIGCGRAQCGNNAAAYFIVCSYDPRGNYIGQSPY